MSCIFGEDVINPWGRCHPALGKMSSILGEYVIQIEGRCQQDWGKMSARLSLHPVVGLGDLCSVPPVCLVTSWPNYLAIWEVAAGGRQMQMLAAASHKIYSQFPANIDSIDSNLERGGRGGEPGGGG